MKKLVFRLAAVIMPAVFVCLAASCNTDEFDERSELSPTGIDGSSALSDYVYVAQFIPFPRDIEDIYITAYNDGKVYFAGTAAHSTGGGDDGNTFITNTHAELYSMGIDGSGHTKLAGYTPPIPARDGISSASYIQNMAIDDEGCLWVVEEWNFHDFDLPVGFDYENDAPWEYLVVLESGCAIRKLGADGSELLSLDITRLQGNYANIYVIAFAVDLGSNSGSKHIYLGVGDYEQPGQSVFVIDTTGNIQLELKSEHNFTRFIKMPDGAMAMPPNQMFGNTGDGRTGVLPIIDLASKSISKTVEIPDIGGQFTHSIEYYKGTGDFDLLISDNVSLYSYALGDDSPAKLLDWIDSNVATGNIREIFMTPDGRILCTNHMWSGSSSGIIMLEKTHISELPEKTVIKLAGFVVSDFMKNSVARFNNENLSHSIEITDYADYSTDTDRRAGLTRLMTEISSGVVPDILETHFLQGMDYENIGLYADLYPFIDADSDIDRSDFIQPVLSAVETDGKLFQAFPSFTISTIIGHPSILGSEPGWNMDEFIAVLDANPGADLPMGLYTTKTEFLKNAVSFNIDEFIDWEAGTAHFDSDSFIQLLEVSDRFPAEAPEGQIGANAQVIEQGRMIMDYVQEVDNYAIFQVKRFFGTVWLDGEYVVKGYPAAGRDGHSVTATSGLAILENSAHKDAAWEFVRRVLDPDWQIYNVYYGFPSTLAALDHGRELALDESNEYGVGLYFEDEYVTLERPTQEDVHLVHALMDALPADSSRVVPETLLDIITESASDYFDGRSTAEDAARVIQSRVSIYVSERS